MRRHRLYSFIVAQLGLATDGEHINASIVPVQLPHTRRHMEGWIVNSTKNVSAMVFLNNSIDAPKVQQGPKISSG